MNKKIIAAVGIFLSAFFLYLFLKDVNWNELADALTSANYYWLIPNIATVFIAMALRAWRWGYMVRPIKKCAFHSLYAATMIGFMASNVLPARLGEFVRPISLGKIENISRSAAMATTLVERVFDLLTLLALFTIVILYKDLPESSVLQNIEKAGWVFLVITIAAFVVMVLLKVRTESTLRVLNKILQIFPKKIQVSGSNIFEKFAAGLEVLSDSRAIFMIAFQSILLWVLMAVSNYLIFLAFGLQLPLDASFMVLAIVSVGIMLPQAPGFIGGYQLLTFWSLSFYSVPEASSKACAIIMWATQYFTVTIAGLYHLKKEHLTLKEEDHQIED